MQWNRKQCCSQLVMRRICYRARNGGCLSACATKHHAICYSFSRVVAFATEYHCKVSSHTQRTTGTFQCHQQALCLQLSEFLTANVDALPSMFAKLLRTACNDLKVSASLNRSRLQRANDLGVGSGWEAVVMFIHCQVQVVGKPHFEPVVR